MLKPDITARVRLYHTANGGKSTAIPPVQFGCVFRFEGEYFDCRLLLDQVQIMLNPGDAADVPIKFMFPELIKARLKHGDSFELWDGRDIAEGTVLEVM
ncbi:MAG: hypothetical protein ACOX1P_11955 [Thermoguttaceae bacterium]|jgi:hypothetical protein